MIQPTRQSLWFSPTVAWVLFGVVIVVLGGYVVYPSLQLLSEGFKISAIAELFSSVRSANVRALSNSVWISLWTVMGSAVVGTSLAYLFFRFEFRFKKLLMGLAALPLALPPLVGVLAFLFLYGESGILPRSIQLLFNLETIPFSFNGLWAVLTVHVYSMYVFFYLFCSASLRNVDRSLVEASYDTGAGQVRTFFQIILPQLRGAIVSSSLLVFMISMASFTAPLLFAGSKNFLTLQIYNYKTNGNLEAAATISIILTAICLIFLILIEFRSRSKPSTTASKGAAPLAVPIQSGWGRFLALTVGMVLLTLLLLPIATIVLISFVKEGSWTYQVFPQEYTWANYANLVSQSDVFEPIINSLQMAAIATTGNILFGVMAALVLAKGRLPGRGVLRGLAILPFAIPGTVIALNLIVTFNQPSALTLGNVLVGSFWMLPLAYFIRHIPLVFRSTLAALESYDDRMSEASTDLGASRLQTLRRVVLPSIAPGITAGALLTFVTALGEFVSSIMLYVFQNRPISVEILSQLRLYDFGAAAAYSVFLMFLIGLSTLVIRRSPGKTQPSVAPV
ncbi:MAG: iron ABC transporter permease [Bacteroidetes bacterium]|nr:iron ABC transporter permease [Bacteroidota bacterium]